jgi:hypothetical protein
MGRVDAITARALNFGLDDHQDPRQAAAALLLAAGHDGRVLRQAIVRVERGCRQCPTPAEDRALRALGLALSAVADPCLWAVTG